MGGEERRKRAACLLSAEPEARLHVLPPPRGSLTALNLVALLGGGGVPHGRTGASREVGLRRPSRGKGGNPERGSSGGASLGADRPLPSLPSPSHSAFPAIGLPLPPLCSSRGGGLPAASGSKEAAAKSAGWFVRLPPSLPRSLPSSHTTEMTAAEAPPSSESAPYLRARRPQKPSGASAWGAAGAPGRLLKATSLRLLGGS